MEGTENFNAFLKEQGMLEETRVIALAELFRINGAKRLSTGFVISKKQCDEYAQWLEDLLTKKQESTTKNVGSLAYEIVVDTSEISEKAGIIASILRPYNIKEHHMDELIDVIMDMAKTSEVKNEQV